MCLGLIRAKSLGINLRILISFYFQQHSIQVHWNDYSWPKYDVVSNCCTKLYILHWFYSSALLCMSIQRRNIPKQACGFNCTAHSERYVQLFTDAANLSSLFCQQELNECDLMSSKPALAFFLGCTNWQSNSAQHKFSNPLELQLWLGGCFVLAA